MNKRIDHSNGKRGLLRNLLGENITLKYSATGKELKGKLTFGYRENGNLIEIEPYDFTSQEGTKDSCYRLLVDILGSLPVHLKNINLEKSSLEDKLVIIEGIKLS